MQSVIRSSEERVRTQRKTTEAARVRAFRNNLPLMIFLVLLLLAFVLTNILLLRDFLKQPFGGSSDDPRFIGPLLRERLRRARERAREGERKAVKQASRFGRVISNFVRGRRASKGSLPSNSSAVGANNTDPSIVLSRAPVETAGESAAGQGAGPLLNTTLGNASDVVERTDQHPALPSKMQHPEHRRQQQVASALANGTSATLVPSR